MPTLSVFLGILVKMNWKDIGQHKEPHVHAYYGDFEAVYGFDGEIISGKFPPRQHAYMKAWILLNDEDLKANWTLAVNGEEIFRIKGLK